MSELKEMLQQDTVGFAQYDSLRIEMQDRYEEQLKEHKKFYKEQQISYEHMQDKLLQDKSKEILHWKKMCVLSLSILFLLIGSIVASVVYVMNTFEFATYEYEYQQDNSDINNIGDNNNYGAETSNKNLDNY